MLVFIGASASGKTEIVKILIRDYGFNKIITHTTRKKRINEIDGIDYHFLSLSEFFKRKEENYFIETEKYDGNYYGTAFKDTGINNVLIVDPNGANSIYDKGIKNAIYIYLETSESVRESRMEIRGDESIDIHQRVINDRHHFSIKSVKHIDHIIVTDSYTLEELAAMINTIYQEDLKGVNSDDFS